MVELEQQTEGAALMSDTPFEKWTVGKLIETLSQFPNDTPVLMRKNGEGQLSAYSNWYLTVFDAEEALTDADGGIWYQQTNPSPSSKLVVELLTE